MPDAPCLRAQAAHYLDLARHNSGGWEAPALRTRAAECISLAERLEAGEAPEAPDQWEGAQPGSSARK